MVDKETRMKLFKTAQKVVNDTRVKILISEAPTDPKEKEHWVYHMMRIQIAMWIEEGAICAHCKHQYESVDDFLAREPKGGYGGDRYVCSECWDEYKAIKQRSEAEH